MPLAVELKVAGTAVVRRHRRLIRPKLILTVVLLLQLSFIQAK